MVPNSRQKHKSKKIPEVMRGLVLDFLLYCYCMTKHPLNVTSAQGTTQGTLYII